MQFFFKKKQKCKIYLSKETTTVCFQHGMVYGDFKSLPRRTACDKVLRDKTFNIVKIQYIIEIKKALLQWFINFLIRGLQGMVFRFQVKLWQASK